MDNKSNNNIDKSNKANFNFDDMIIELEGNLEGNLEGKTESTTSNSNNVTDDLVDTSDSKTDDNSQDSVDSSSDEPSENNDMQDVSDDVEQPDAESLEDLDSGNDSSDINEGENEEPNGPAGEEENKKEDENKPEGEEENKKEDENKPEGEEENKKEDENKPEGEEENKKEDENKPEGEEENKKEDENKPEGGEENKKEDENKPAGEENKKNDDQNKENPQKRENDNSGKPNGDNNNQNGNKNENQNKPQNNQKEGNDSNKNNNANRRQNNKGQKGDPGLKDKLKNGAKNRAKNIANNAKQGAKDKFNNSGLGQAVNGAKNAYDKGKKAVETVKKAKKTIAAAKAAIAGLGGLFGSLPLLLPIILLLIIIIVIWPGNRGERKESTYSKTDQKTLEKIDKIVNKYPNADATLAMVAVVYPYYDVLWSSDVTINVDGDHSYETDDTKLEADEDDDDKEEIQEEEDKKETNDLYLELFRKYSYRKNFKTLLKKLDGGSESDYEQYLIDTYFKKDKGYKSMFNAAKDPEQLKEQIIADLKEKKDMFVNYVYQNAVCAATMVDAGQVATADLLKSNILIDLKKPGCSNMGSCSESYYDHYLTLEEYIKGVVYEEISGNNDLNQVAAQMVAAKSFTLSRRTNSIKVDSATGSYVIPMLWSTADQDFCHTELGCNSSDINHHYGYNNGGDERLIHGANRGPASDEQKKLYNEAWNLSKDVYVVNNDGTPAAAAYWAGCSAGKCMDSTKLPNYAGIDFKSILGTFYSSYSVATIAGDVSNVQVKGAQVCTNRNTNYTATRAKIVSFALNQVDKIPFYRDGLANAKTFEDNNFGSEVSPDSDGRTKKGLGSVGFVNWIYWNIIDDNLGNSNSIDKIISQSFEIKQDKLLMGDIGYSSDKSVVGIYAGDNKWILEDAVSGTVVTKPDDRFTTFIRLNVFKNEAYEFSVRDHKPNPSEWGGSNMFVKPSTPALVGECVWYAKNRAGEIITELYKNGSLTEKQYKKYYKRVSTTRGNGADFYPRGTADNGYNGSTNPAELKAGSFIGMSAQKTEAGRKYGHVAVIEYVSDDKIIMTEGYKTRDRNDNRMKCSSYVDFSCVSFNTKTFKSYQEFYNYYHNPKIYMFKGYLYFLEE